ncbi:MAG TPA: GTP cyclohydrolase II [Candidatus Poseidoniia archaeon]|jgi:3,4-dihydroxy 2-butanone 4-phosphate synthase/GTP cyclohydrolase II|nr:GTP cyclohydrolase II [Candidatus Poseidoniia archaeon]
MSEIREPLVEARLPTKYGTFRIIAFPGDSADKENLALVMGEVEGEILIRIHSECFTGDVLHSMRCDCGEQLDLAMKKISKEGKGIIIYLRQEGRGIGLVNKLKAYNLQDDGMDTVEANIALGFNAEMRRYEGAVEILENLGVKKIKLMTNNPAKVEDLEKAGFEVEQIGHSAEPNEENKDYLRTKASKMNHKLEIRD